jgi:Holliday junction resolvasome RuvABC endonuclease subunit
VMRLLKLPGLPGPDAADALGLAITHAHVGSRQMVNIQAQRVFSALALQPR